HLPDTQLVGPSLVEIRDLYRDKPEAFINWSKNPQRKREGAVEMPSMAHVPDDQLAMIHAHILKVSAGLKERKVEPPVEKPAEGPDQSAEPRVTRIFMPDSGPASIAVSVDATYSFCWDAGSCRLRYVWRDGYIDASKFLAGQGRGSATVIGKRLLLESEPPLAELGEAGSPKFLGYRLKEGIPTFFYRLGKHHVSERLEPSGGGLLRRFSIKPAPEGTLSIPIAEQDGVSWACDKGSLSDGRLVLPPGDAAAFTLSLIEP
ncbi:MAG: hypothetical protein AAGB14_10485, partial [Verrucomicrobiota bacterium]